MPPVAESKIRFRYLSLNPRCSKAIWIRVFLGSEPKFAAPLARPPGASQRNCDPTPKTTLHHDSLRIFGLEPR
jgi:hypothetical protein